MGRNRTYDRQTVLEQAVRQFWRHGYLATSISDMTQITGMNTASMYKEFGDKNGLFEAALQYYRTEFLDPRCRMVADRPDLDGIRAFVDSVAAGAEKFDYAGCLMMNHIAQKHVISADAAAMIDDFCDTIESLLRDAFENARRKGQISGDKDPASLASFVLCWVHGVVLYARRSENRGSVAGLRDRVLDSILA